MTLSPNWKGKIFTTLLIKSWSFQFLSLIDFVGIKIFIIASAKFLAANILFSFYCIFFFLKNQLLFPGKINVLLNYCMIFRAGGLVQAMRWNSTSERLVVSFVESNSLAVFITRVSGSGSLSISPLGFIIGQTKDEYPSCFEFANHFNEGSLLTIAWSSGRVQHFPMFYTQGADTSHHHQDSKHLSTSHLLNNSLNALADFEPQLFSSPAI